MKKILPRLALACRAVPAWFLFCPVFLSPLRPMIISASKAVLPARDLRHHARAGLICPRPRTRPSSWATHAWPIFDMNAVAEGLRPRLEQPRLRRCFAERGASTMFYLAAGKQPQPEHRAISASAFTRLRAGDYPATAWRPSGTVVEITPLPYMAQFRLQRRICWMSFCLRPAGALQPGADPGTPGALGRPIRFCGRGRANAHAGRRNLNRLMPPRCPPNCAEAGHNCRDLKQSLISTPGAQRGEALHQSPRFAGTLELLAATPADSSYSLKLGKTCGRLPPPGGAGGLLCGKTAIELTFVTAPQRRCAAAVSRLRAAEAWTSPMAPHKRAGRLRTHGAAVRGSFEVEPEAVYAEEHYYDRVPPWMWNGGLPEFTRARCSAQRRRKPWHWDFPDSVRSLWCGSTRSILLFEGGKLAPARLYRGSSASCWSGKSSNTSP